MTHEPHDPTAPRRQPDHNSPQEGAAIPLPLQNWRVLEIDGEATIVETDSPQVAGNDFADDFAEDDGAVDALRAPIADRGDEVIVLGLSPRRVELAAGERAPLTVELLNNGPVATQFVLSVEGWLPEAWLALGEQSVWPVRVYLQPGERRTLVLHVSLPQRPPAAAGDHPFALVAQAERYPNRRARVGAVVAVAPVDAFGVGAAQPALVKTGWFRRSARFLLPVSNLGNRPLRLTVVGIDRDRELDFAFDRTHDTGVDTLQGSDDDWEFGMSPARLHLGPGEAARVGVTVTPRRRVLAGFTPVARPFRLMVRADRDPAARRVVDMRLLQQPLLGPWHFLGAALGGVFAFFALGLSGLALLLALRGEFTPTAPVAPAPVATPAAPMFAFVIQLDQPAQTARSAEPVAAGQAQAVPPPSNGAPALPVVRADQITAPGQPTPLGQAPLLPVVSAPPAAASPRVTADQGMTYAQMFQEIGLRYDLDWRLLAAVAYVESGFDSLALSSAGDMGLMQIRPATWREFAPALGASDPFDSYANVLVAARYLDYLRTLFSTRGYPQVELMLIAYNWGPEPVLNHLAAGGAPETLPAERRLYAEDVLRTARSIPAD